MQDGNWPVSVPIKSFFENHITQIQDELFEILKSDDNIWKYWILLGLGKGITDVRIITEIKRIAINPTNSEMAENLNKIASDLIAEKSW